MRCAAGKLGVSDLTLRQFQDQGISDPQNLEAAAARVREKINQFN